MVFALSIVDAYMQMPGTISMYPNVLFPKCLTPGLVGLGEGLGDGLGGGLASLGEDQLGGGLATLEGELAREKEQNRSII